MTDLCRVVRVRESDSFAAGPIETTYICGELDGHSATETVLIDGEPTPMCKRCAGEAVKEFDAQEVASDRSAASNKLHSVADYLQLVAQDFASRPQIVAWLSEASQMLDGMAVDVLEGKL
jgi:hypothetical protein